MRQVERVAEVMVEISVELDGEPSALHAEPRALLGQVLRDDCGIDDIRLDCETSTCGSCTVLLDGDAVKSCAMLAPMADGHAITTVGGLPEDGVVGEVKRGLSDRGVLPCGECRSAFQLVLAALVAKVPRPSRDEIARAMSGTMCRCTGYGPIIDAVLASTRSVP